MLVTLDDAPDVVALIPTLGRDPERLGRAVSAVAEQDSGVKVAVLVIVNGSETVAIAGATTATAGLNLGWAGGLAFGRSLVNAPYLWLVQDDMEPAVECLRYLLDALAADDSIALASPLVLDADGLVKTGSCGGKVSVDAEFPLWQPAEPTPPSELGELELDYVPSRGMLVRTRDWDAAGGMDPRFYPVLWVDVDFCTTVRRSGRNFALERRATTRHLGTASSDREYAEFLLRRNRGIYREKWEKGRAVDPIDPRIPTVLLETVAVCASATLLALSLRHGDNARRVTQLDGELEGLRGELADIRASTSWRVTAPIRRITSALRRSR